MTQMPESEVSTRLERIAAYNLYHQRAGQSHHCLTVDQLAKVLEGWGSDPRRAKGIGIVPPPSQFLNQRVAPTTKQTEGEF